MAVAAEKEIHKLQNVSSDQPVGELPYSIAIRLTWLQLTWLQLTRLHLARLQPVLFNCNPPEQFEVRQHFAGSQDHARQRILGDRNGQPCLFANPLI
jgi:hypothetical protein